jgi:hypothetical protein
MATNQTREIGPSQEVESSRTRTRAKEERLNEPRRRRREERWGRGRMAEGEAEEGDEVLVTRGEGEK